MRSARPCRSSTPLPSVSAAVDSEWSRAVGLHHRDWARTASAQARRAMASSHVRPLDSARKLGRARQARTKTSWVTSSASFGPTRWAATLHTSAWLIRIAAPSASRSPSRACTKSPVKPVHRPEDTREPRSARGRLPTMDCDTAQSAISARLDGEDLGVDPVDLADHLERCTPCRTLPRC